MAINPGVYLIKNKVSGKRYVGSSCNLDRRIKEHIYRWERGIHANNHLQATCLENLEFFIIKKCKNYNEALTFEQEYLDFYNLYKYGYNQTKFVKHPATKAISTALKGRSLSDTHKENLKGPRLNTRGKAHWRTYPVGQYTKQGKLIKVWECGVAGIAKQLKISRSGIDNCIQGLSKHSAGYVWKKLAHNEYK